MPNQSFLQAFYEAIDRLSKAVESENIAYQTQVSNKNKKPLEEQKMTLSETYFHYCKKFQQERLFEKISLEEKNNLLERVKTLETLLMENKIYIDARVTANERYKKIIVKSLEKISKPVSYYNAIGHKKGPFSFSPPLSINSEF